MSHSSSTVVAAAPVCWKSWIVLACGCRGRRDGQFSKILEKDA